MEMKNIEKYYHQVNTYDKSESNKSMEGNSI